MLVNGICIRAETPYKDDVGSGYSATFYPSKNAVLVTKPSMPYLLRNCKEAAKEVAQAVAKSHADFHYPTTYPDALSASAFAVESSESRQTVKALLRFSKSHFLTNKVYSGGDDQEGEEIKLIASLVPVVGDPKKKLDGKEGEMKWVLEWFLSDVEEEPRRWQEDSTKLVSGKEVAMAHAEQAFAGLGLGKDSVAELNRRREREELRRKEQAFELKVREELAKVERERELVREARRAAEEAKRAALSQARSEQQQQQQAFLHEAQWSARKEAEAELARHLAVLEKESALREAQREAEFKRRLEEQSQQLRDKTDHLQELLLKSFEERAEAEEKRAESKLAAEADMEVDQFSPAEQALLLKRTTKGVAKPAKRSGGLTKSKSRLSTRGRAVSPKLKAPPGELKLSPERQTAEESYAGSLFNNTAAAAASAAVSLFNAVKTSSPMRPEQSVEAPSPASTTSSIYFGTGRSGTLSPVTRSMTRNQRNMPKSAHDLVLEGLDTWEAPHSRSQAAFARAGGGSVASIESLDLTVGDVKEVDVESTYGQEDDDVDGDLTS
jgi:hypothetical protein